MFRQLAASTIGVLKKLFETPPPPPELKIEHPQFGTMAFHYNECTWTGSVQSGENVYEVIIDGDTSGPDAEPLSYAEERMEQLPEIESRIRKFLSDYIEPLKEDSLKIALTDFVITSFDFCEFRVKRRSIWVCLELSWDTYGSWRMEYFDNEIRDFGRDS